MPQFDLMHLVLTWGTHGPGSQLDRVALVPTRGSTDTADCGLIYPSPDQVILFPIWACMALVTLVLTQASLRPGYSIPHLGLTLTRDLWSYYGPQTKLVTLVPLWASPLPGDSGHPLGFTWAW